MAPLVATSLLVITLTLSNINGDHVSTSTRYEILDKHNELRAGVSPSAANMLQMHWSKPLADAANQWANTCPDHHDGFDDRRQKVGLGISVGQNLAFNYDSWDDAIQAWYDEVEDFRYGSTGGYVLHFTQMTQALSSHVGCAIKRCYGSVWDVYYVCNYAYLQTDVARPWEEGPPCSQCGGRCRNNLCDCGDVLCENDNQMDTTTCTCQCRSPYTGRTCSETHCQPDPSYCGQPQPYGFEPQHCTVWTNVPEECPNMCGVC